MTDLLHVLPDFDTTAHSHLIPSLERHLITCTDLLTLEASDVARRAHLPVLDVRKLVTALLAQLRAQLGLTAPGSVTSHGNPDVGNPMLRRTGPELVRQWSTISTLDGDLDGALGGGIPTGYITEITGERYLVYSIFVPLSTTQNTADRMFRAAVRARRSSS